jgi:hypothetical protein
LIDLTIDSASATSARLTSLRVFQIFVAPKTKVADPQGRRRR